MSTTAKSILPEIKADSIAALCQSEADAQGTSIAARQAVIPILPSSASRSSLGPDVCTQGAAKLGLPAFPAERDSTGNEQGHEPP